MRELRVEDALLYLDQVKVEFGDRPHIYNEFLEIMKTFKTQQIDTPGVIRRVSNLFQGNKRLVLGFNTFLPEGYKIELPLDGDGPPVAVFRAPGETVTHILSGPGAPPPLPPPPPAQSTATVAGAPAADNQAAQKPPAVAGTATGRPGGPPPPRVAGHPSGLGHPPSQMAPVQRGPGSVAQQGGIAEAGAPGPTSVKYQPHPTQQTIHMQQQQQQQQQQQPPQHRGHLGQAPQMAVGADSATVAAAAAARARIEQQGRGPAGPPMPSRGGHVAQPPASSRVGMSVIQQPNAPEPKAPPRPGTVQQHMAGSAHHPSAGMQQGQHHMGMHSAQAQASVAPPAPPPPPQQHQSQAASGSGAPAPQQPLEFDHAINYVTTIKKRFANEPETYKKFLEILHTYQKEQRGIQEVLEEVSTLFSEHPDLLKEFTYFLPDAVQAEAKAQLEQAALEAEARKRAAVAAKQSMMQQAPPPVARRQPAPAMPPAAPPQVPAVAAPPPQRAPPPVTMPLEIPQPTAPQPPSTTPIMAPIPFGATKGRSLDREREIVRKAVYGKVSFAPNRPPRKNALTVSQAATKNGRPTMLPPLANQPTTAETAFFERAKRHLNRRELAPDKPSGSRRHTPYTEFLKCLHLFGAGVLNKDELVLLLRGLFMQGHAPKSGANAGGGASNPTIANDAQDLLKEFEEILVGRGPYAIQESNAKDRSKYGSKRSRDFDFRDCDRPTTSYVSYPSDYPMALFMTHTGQTDEDTEVLNDRLICVGAERMRLTGSPEEYDAVRIRRNAYEEAMFRIEDERFEVDMAIERNAHAMRQIEPISEEATELRLNEETDGQPIGRLQYQLNPRTLNSIQINAIGRIYGDNGDEVIEHLARNPLSVVPIVYKRLREKDQEWRKQKSELMTKWKATCEANYEGSMDVMCYFNRKEVERSFSADQLRDECKRARSYCSEPELRMGSSVSFGLSSPDRSAVLYEPYAVVEMKPDTVGHLYAVKLLMSQIINRTTRSKSDREKIGRVWTEFLVPFFNYPVQWVADEARESFRGNMNNHIVQYATGQTVRTAFGDGTILAFYEDDGHLGPRYRIKFPYGTGYVYPSAIMHVIYQKNGPKFVRRGGMMEKDDESAAARPRSGAKLDKKFKLLFGSDTIYVFVRLYTFLVSSMDEINSFLRVNPTIVDPASRYYNPMKSSQGEKKMSSMMKKNHKMNFKSIMEHLHMVVLKKLSIKDYETICRRIAPDIVHKMASLPKLIEKCSEMLVQTCKEELILRIYDHCQYTCPDPLQLRSACLSVSPEAEYRIQYNTTNGRMYFSYLPEGEELLTVPTGDDDDDDDDDDILDDDDDDDDDVDDDDDDDDDDEPMEDGEVVDSDDDDDDIMDVEDEEEDLRQVKRMKTK